MRRPRPKPKPRDKRRDHINAILKARRAMRRVHRFKETNQ